MRRAEGRAAFISIIFRHLPEQCVPDVQKIMNYSHKKHRCHHDSGVFVFFYPYLLFEYAVEYMRRMLRGALPA